jgi:ribokinase
MASDRGVAPELAPDDVEDSWLEGCDVLHVSGYSLLRSPIDEASLRAAELARAAGARVSLDLSSASTIRALGAARFRRLLASLEPDVVFGTEAELAEVGAVAAATVVEKRGADGIRVDDRAYPARPAEVVDATGAGDATAAGFLVGGPELAVEAAARCVSQLGAMP